MRRWVRSAGLNDALSGIERRGPAAKDQTLPSVRPSKWQLEHDCQPSEESRSVVEVVGAVLAGRSKFPREEKKTSAPTVVFSAAEPGGGSGAVRMTRSTRSLRRSTCVTLRETEFTTHARVPASLTTMPSGFLPALSPLVAGFAGSLRSM